MWRDGEGKAGSPQKPLGGFPVSAKNPQAARAYELDTIEGRVTTAWATKRRSRGRSNSIRRSKALERIMGKRARTCCRWARKPDAINAPLVIRFGNERGSAMVSWRKIRR